MNDAAKVLASGVKNRDAVPVRARVLYFLTVGAGRDGEFTTPELAEEIGCSPSAIYDAVRILFDAGVLDRRYVPSGTRVAHRSSDKECVVLSYAYRSAT